MSQSKTVIKLSQEFEVISTCYHEIGHTVYGLLNHIKISSVSAEITEGRAEGFTWFETYSHPISDPEVNKKLIISEVCISYAGLMSERLFYKEICGAEKLPMILKSGSGPDINNAADLIKKYNLAPAGKERAAYKKKLYKQITDTLSVRWSDIKLLSHFLYKKKKINYDDLKKILTKKSKDKEFWKLIFKDIELLFNAEQQLDEKNIKHIICQ